MSAVLISSRLHDPAPPVPLSSRAGNELPRTIMEKASTSAFFGWKHLLVSLDLCICMTQFHIYLWIPFRIILIESYVWGISRHFQPGERSKWAFFVIVQLQTSRRLVPSSILLRLFSALYLVKYKITKLSRWQKGGNYYLRPDLNGDIVNTTTRHNILQFHRLLSKVEMLDTNFHLSPNRPPWKLAMYSCNWVQQANCNPAPAPDRCSPAQYL